MKARVKATGEIVTARGIYTRILTPYGMEEVDCYDMDEAEIIHEPDYWEKLKHQYAGMAMQGYISNSHYNTATDPAILARVCSAIATALVEKLKEK